MHVVISKYKEPILIISYSAKRPNVDGNRADYNGQLISSHLWYECLSYVSARMVSRHKKRNLGGCLAPFGSLLSHLDQDPSSF